MPLPPDIVRVVWWRHGDTEPHLLEPFASWLSVGESARRERLRFERDRVTFLASRILLRQTLAEATGYEPASFMFSTDAHGIKPLVTAPHDAVSVQFSLTHTDGLVACAISRAGAVGIDAEPWARPTRVAALATRVLSAQEFAALDAVEPARRQRRFLEYWTVKEAWLKAMGTGLRVPPASVEVGFADGTTSAESSPRLIDSDWHRDWRVQLLHDSPDHALALVHPRFVDAARPTIVIVAQFAVPSRS